MFADAERRSWTLHLFGLCAFALSQPVYETLGRYPEFLVAHRIQAIDIVLLILSVSGAVPVLLAAAVTAAGAVGRKAGATLYAILVTVLITLVVLNAIGRSESLPVYGRCFLAVGAGAGSAWAALRFSWLQQLMRVFALAAFVFPLFFLLQPNIRNLMSLERGGDSVGHGLLSRPPILLLVFDELPVWSLLDQQGRINKLRYPNFAAFANRSNWFRNARAPSDGTNYAIPAILTGRIPTDAAPPSVKSYPRNLFSWLRDDYRIVALEWASGLCPNEACESPIQPESRWERLRNTICDLTLIYLHVVVPKQWAHGLPSISGQWRDFWGRHQAPFGGGRSSQSTLAESEFMALVDSLQPQDGMLYFLHSRLPHVPWEYLPSGKRYGPVTTLPVGVQEEMWGPREWETIQGYQRHILQLQFLDHLMGRLLKRLDETGLLDRALVIVTADHGVSFIPGVSRRHASEQNLQAISAVPLFVKLPEQTEGRTIDRTTQTIDIVPTIAEVLDAKFPWETDGVSLITTEPHIRPSARFVLATKRPLEALDLPAKADGSSIVARKIDLFGTGSDPLSIFQIGDGMKLIGRPVSHLSIAERTDLRVEIRDALRYDQVTLHSPLVPAYVTGSVLAQRGVVLPHDLAIAVNGYVRAVTKTYGQSGQVASFAAMVPEEALRNGTNELEVFVIEPDSESVFRMTNDRPEFVLSRGSKGEEILQSMTGRSFRVIPGAVRGGFDRIESVNQSTIFTGWAAEPSKDQPSGGVVALATGGSRKSYFVLPDRRRLDVVKYFNKPGLELSGFALVVPTERYRLAPGVRLYGKQLVIDFEGADALRSRIFELAQIAAHDREQFQRAVESPNGLRVFALSQDEPIASELVRRKP